MTKFLTIILSLLTWTLPMSVGSSPNPDRLPPQNLEAEQGMLGAILIDNDAISDVIPLVDTDHLYRDSHQRIFQAVLDLYLAGKPVDLIILSDELARRGELDQVGGIDALTSLVASVPSSANARYHAGIVREKATARRLIESANAILRDGYSNNYTADQLIESAERSIFAVADGQSDDRLVKGPIAALAAMDQFSSCQTVGRPVGVTTGIPELDNIIGGLAPGRLYIIGARPSIGKTALAMNILDHATVHCRVPSLIFSMEMGYVELATRRLQSFARISSDILSGKIKATADDWERVGNAYNTIKDSPLDYDETPHQTVTKIMSRVRREKIRSNLGLVVIDYIQLMNGDGGRESRQEQITGISRRLKEMARDVGVPVVVLSQLNRKSEDRTDQTPRMSDLRESGSIEQDADVVILLHRPEFYDPNDRPGEALAIIAKQRNGPTGTIRLRYRKSFMKFESFDSPADDGAY